MADRFTVVFLSAAARELRSCPPPIRQRLKTAIDSLATNPHPPGAQRLRGPDRLIRIRVGDYRILYRVIRERLVVLVVRVGHRREVYREMARRRLGAG
jgi:mRNA interferase RelE/StbE